MEVNFRRCQVWQIEKLSGKIRGRIYAQCGYHKCMTMHARRAYRRACRGKLGLRRGIAHHGHDLEAFYARCSESRIASVSGHALDLDRLESIRVVRLIRDPRDLLVSAYHYHKRGAEAWSHAANPAAGAWEEVRGFVPEGFPAQHSMKRYLAEASFADGLRMEYEFRRHHFSSMRDWPEDDPRVRLYRYEDILGREVDTFEDIFRFMEFGPLARWAGLNYARRHAATKRRARRDHIRNAQSGQWREVLPDDVVKAFVRDYGDILARYGYPLT